MLSNNRDIRTSSATSGGMFGSTANRSNALNGTVRSRNDSPSGAGPHPNVVIDNLVRQWQLAEQRLLSLIHNAYVPASDMTPAGKRCSGACVFLNVRTVHAIFCNVYMYHPSRNRKKSSIVY